MNSVTVPPIDFASLPRAELADDGGRKLDAILCVTADIAHAVAEAVRQGYAVMPAGGLTSAINSFDYSKDALAGGFKDVVAIRAKSAVAAEVVADDTPLEALKTNQVAIRKDKGLVAAGAGLTFEQVNAALAEHVGPTARVLIDLTSVASAWVGGVIATGGMGPLRTRPSNILDAVCLADGGDPRVVEGYDNILGVEGMQGWTGMVAAAQFRFFLVPSSEFGLVLPVQGSDVDAIAGLMAYLEPWTRVVLPEAGGRLAAGDGGETVLNGIELVSRDSLVAFVEHAGEPARTKAQGLLQSCEYANADMLACLTGWSEQSVDDVLMSLLDPETETIGGIMIDYGVGFSSGAEMDTFRAIREGAPDLARTRARVTPPGKLKPYSTSTDINVVTPADSSVIADILTAYADYRAAIRGLAAELDGTVEVEIWAYGHLSTNGIDPHHRVILFANQGEEGAFAGAKQAVAAHKRALIRDILRAAERGGALVNGGEKGVPSLVEIARAAGGEARLPDDLKQRLGRARAAVAAAPAAFTFRVPTELK
jgi:FAD/FMN-containing dehydrogenase